MKIQFTITEGNGGPYKDEWRVLARFIVENCSTDKRTISIDWLEERRVL